MNLELRSVEDPDRADQFEADQDQFELILTDSNGDLVTYSTTREELKKVLLKFLYRLER